MGGVELGHRLVSSRLRDGVQQGSHLVSVRLRAGWGVVLQPVPEPGQAGAGIPGGGILRRLGADNQIAAALGIADGTVAAHLSAVRG